MGAFAAGQVIVVPFPFSDLSAQKYRPALMLADAGRGDWILRQITINPFSNPLAIELNESAFSQGSLQRISYARPGKLFTSNATSLAMSSRHKKRLNIWRSRCRRYGPCRSEPTTRMTFPAGTAALQLERTTLHAK